MPFVPAMGIIFSSILMLSLPILTWFWFGGWLILGAIIYFAYGRSRAKDFPCQENLKKIIAETEASLV